MMTIDQIQDRIIEEFADHEDWLDTYGYLVSLGREHASDEGVRSEEHALGGCQSKVWIAAQRDGEVLRIRADSDSLIIRGILVLLLRILDGRRPGDIANADLYFLDSIGLNSGLSPTRANGLALIVKTLKDMGSRSAGVWECG
jgi:cysteine desulfuration protein SufE